MFANELVPFQKRSVLGKDTAVTIVFFQKLFFGKRKVLTIVQTPSQN